MGIKDLLTAALIASSWYPQDSQDLEKLTEQADSLYQKSTPDDREKALKIYEQIFEQTADQDIEKKLIQCRLDVTAEKFNLAQTLWEFDAKPRTVREKLSAQYKIKNLNEAREMAKPLYKTVIEQGERIVKARPLHSETWKVLSVSYARFNEIDKALDASRMHMRLKPQERDAYNMLFAAYLARNDPGAILDDLKKIEYVEEDVKISKLTEGVNKLFSDFRSKGIVLVFNTKEIKNKQKAAELFYLTSKTRWDQELKKEKMVDFDFIDAMHDCHRAGTLDLLSAENDEQREAAFQRYQKSFDYINSKLQDGLGRLDKSYHLNFFKIQTIKMSDSDKVYEFLKSKLEKKK